MGSYAAVMADFVAGATSRQLRNGFSSIEFSDLVPDMPHSRSDDGPFEVPSVSLKHSFGFPYACQLAGKYGLAAIKQHVVLRNSALWIDPDKFKVDRYNISDAIRSALVDKTQRSGLPFLLEGAPELKGHIDSSTLELLFTRLYSPFHLEFGVSVNADGTTERGFVFAMTPTGTYLDVQGWARPQYESVCVFDIIPQGQRPPAVVTSSANERPEFEKATYKPTLDFFLALASGEHGDEMARWLSTARAKWQEKPPNEVKLA